MLDIVIGKVEVIGIEKKQLRPTPEAPDAKTVVATTLKITPVDHPDPRLQVHGTITIPLQLPFGADYLLCLHPVDALPEGGRLFKEEEH